MFVLWVKGDGMSLVQPECVKYRITEGEMFCIFKAVLLHVKLCSFEVPPL